MEQIPILRGCRKLTAAECAALADEHEATAALMYDCPDRNYHRREAAAFRMLARERSQEETNGND